MKLARALLAVFVVLVAGAAPVRAATQTMANDGTVHRIDVDPWVSLGKPSGTALRHTRQAPDGSTVSAWIPGTDDAAIDRDPAIVVEPGTGAVVVVWSRLEGGGYNLFAARWSGGAWSAPRALLPSQPDRTKPQVRVTERYVHVLWTQSGGSGASFGRAVIDAASLDVAYGPEPLSADCSPVVPTSGDDSLPTSDPDPGDVFFVTETAGRLPSDPSRIVVWGVRDEPVPIDYRQPMALPTGMQSVTDPGARLSGDRLVVWYQFGTRLYYSLREMGDWSDLRWIDITSGSSASDARKMLFEMLRRTSTSD